MPPSASSRLSGAAVEQRGREALADQAPLSVAAVGIEAVADDRLAIADDVGDHGNQTERHLREVDEGIGDGRGDRSGALPDVDNAHEKGVSCIGGWRAGSLIGELAGCRDHRTPAVDLALQRLREGLRRGLVRRRIGADIGERLASAGSLSASAKAFGEYCTTASGVFAGT